MKRFAWLFLAVLCSAILLNAKDNTMTGWVCDSKCVVQNDNRASCDPGCMERSGDVVFISDEGTVSAVSNPDMCSSHMNKHVKATFSSEEQNDLNKAVQNTIRVEELRDETVVGGGGGGK